MTSPTTSGELKACASCGSNTARRPCLPSELSMGGEDDGFFVVCDVHNDGCGASGGFGVSVEDAATKWNRRASPWKYPSRDGLPEVGKEYIFVVSFDGSDTESKLVTTYQPELFSGSVNPHPVQLIRYAPVPEVPASEEI